MRVPFFLAIVMAAGCYASIPPPGDAAVGDTDAAPVDLPTCKDLTFTIAGARPMLGLSWTEPVGSKWRINNISGEGAGLSSVDDPTQVPVAFYWTGPPLPYAVGDEVTIVVIGDAADTQWIGIASDTAKALTWNAPNCEFASELPSIPNPFPDALTGITLSPVCTVHTDEASCAPGVPEPPTTFYSVTLSAGDQHQSASYGETSGAVTGASRMRITNVNAAFRPGMWTDASGVRCGEAGPCSFGFALLVD